MNRTEFINKVAEKTGASKKDVDAITKASLEAIEEALTEGEAVAFVGFGTFSVGERAAREGKNPLTGQPMTIEACKVPKFKPGKALKDAVNK